MIKLFKGLDTLLGKIYENGIHLFGGQWQRIAIARALINNSPINILDESLAAIDPIEETNIYEIFLKIAKDKTTIIVSPIHYQTLRKNILLMNIILLWKD